MCSILRTLFSCVHRGAADAVNVDYACLTEQLLKTKMPNCCVWWYSRHDFETGETTPHLSSVRRIAVSRDKVTGKEVLNPFKQWRKRPRTILGTVRKKSQTFMEN